MSAQQRI